MQCIHMDYTKLNKTIQEIEWLYVQSERSINLINMNLNRFQEICQDLKKLKNREDYTEVDKAIHDVREAVERLKKAAEEKQLFLPSQVQEEQEEERTNPSCQ